MTALKSNYPTVWVTILYSLYSLASTPLPFSFLNRIVVTLHRPMRNIMSKEANNSFILSTKKKRDRTLWWVFFNLTGVNSFIHLSLIIAAKRRWRNNDGHNFKISSFEFKFAPANDIFHLVENYWFNEFFKDTPSSWISFLRGQTGKPRKKEKKVDILKIRIKVFFFFNIFFTGFHFKFRRKFWTRGRIFCRGLLPDRFLIPLLYTSNNSVTWF